MATLVCPETGERRIVFARYLVGRSRLAHLRLQEPDVSGEHAVIQWRDGIWELQDLGSRNGTFVNQRRMAAGERTGLTRDDELGFGTGGPRWRLLDDRPPTAMATALDGDAVCVAEDGFLALPSSEEPAAVVYRDRHGVWVVERDGIALHFTVSRDEEYVELAVRSGPQRIALGARSHHYLLLTLARHRLRDREQPAGDQGWVYQDTLADMLDMDEKHLNVAVYRCRKQLGAIGVIGAADVIERRKPTRQIRLGMTRVEIDAP